MATPSFSETETGRAVAEAAARHPGVDLLVLYGSRARDDATTRSDWDFGFIARSSVEVEGLMADLVVGVGADRIDVTDLARASALLRYRAARDGMAAYERTRGAFDRFRFDAVRFWCEASHILERGYDDVLGRLDR